MTVLIAKVAAATFMAITGAYAVGYGLGKLAFLILGV